MVVAIVAAQRIIIPGPQVINYGGYSGSSLDYYSSTNGNKS